MWEISKNACYLCVKGIKYWNNRTQVKHTYMEDHTQVMPKTGRDNDKEIKKDGVLYVNKSNTYKKINVMITAKYKSTLLENKILAISLARLGSATENSEGMLTCSFSASTLREILGDEKGNIYKKLQPVAEHMTKTTFAYLDPETEEFGYFNLIDHAVYSKGVFTITFGTIVKRLTSNLQERYTLFDLQEMISFENTYSFRLFEILRSQAYRNKYEKQTALYGFELCFSIAELKMELGVVDVDQKSVRSVLDKKRYPDYDAAIENAYKYKNKGDDVALFESWREFKRGVLDIAVKEINEKTELVVTYEREKAGRGGKTTGVKFYVTTKDIMEKATGSKRALVEIDERGMDELIDEVRDIVVMEKLSTRDARSLLKAANNDVEIIRQKYAMAENSKTQIINLTAWLISAIKEDYSEPVKKKASKKPNAFHNFDERDYDYDELERTLINRQ